MKRERYRVHCLANLKDLMCSRSEINPLLDQSEINPLLDQRRSKQLYWSSLGNCLVMSLPEALNEVKGRLVKA